MAGVIVVTRAALLIARRAFTWTIVEHLPDDRPNVWPSTRAARLNCTAEQREPVFLPWPEPVLEDGVEALACLPEWPGKTLCRHVPDRCVPNAPSK